MSRLPLLLPLSRLFLLLLFLPSLYFVADAQPGIGAQAAGNDSLMRIIHENKQDLAECKAWNALADKYSRTDVAGEKSCLWRAMDAG